MAQPCESCCVTPPLYRRGSTERIAKAIVFILSHNPSVLRRGWVPQPVSHMGEETSPLRQRVVCQSLEGIGAPTIWAGKPRPYDWKRMNLRRGWVPQPVFLVGVGAPTIWARQPRPYDWRRMNLRRGWGPPARVSTLRIHKQFSKRDFTDVPETKPIPSPFDTLAQL